MVMRGKNNRSESSDSFFAPLADAMTIVASIFFIIFLGLLFAYKQNIDDINQRNKNIIEELEQVKKLKMDKAMSYFEKISDEKFAKVDKINKSLILDTEFLFDTGSSELRLQGKEFIKDQLARMIERILQDKEIGDDILVAIEGHSDCQLFQKDIYKNWILSSQRAISVLREIEKYSDVVKTSNRVKAIGFGDRMPFGRDDEGERQRQECCEMVNNPKVNYKDKRYCIDEVLVKDRRAVIKLEYNTKYIEQINENYRNLLNKYNILMESK